MKKIELSNIFTEKVCNILAVGLVFFALLPLSIGSFLAVYEKISPITFTIIAMISVGIQIFGVVFFAINLFRINIFKK